MISAIGSDVATWHPPPPSYEIARRTHGDPKPGHVESARSLNLQKSQYSRVTTSTSDSPSTRTREGDGSSAGRHTYCRPGAGDQPYRCDPRIRTRPRGRPLMCSRDAVTLRVRAV